MGNDSETLHYQFRIVLQVRAISTLLQVNSEKHTYVSYLYFPIISPGVSGTKTRYPHYLFHLLFKSRKQKSRSPIKGQNGANNNAISKVFLLKENKTKLRHRVIKITLPAVTGSRTFSILFPNFMLVKK